MSNTPKLYTARQAGLIHCEECALLVPRQHEGEHCPRCDSRLHSRRPHALSHTWALLITAALLFLPANLLPIMTFTTLGRGEPSTIMGGIITLFEHDMPGIATVVLVASILIPLGKLIGLTLLLLAVQRGWTTNMQQKMLMYRFVQWIGRWSMLDIFVVGILVALVKLGQLASIAGNHGATAFAGVVISTMLAAISFDTRLIWDKHLEQNGHSTDISSGKTPHE